MQGTCWRRTRLAAAQPNAAHRAIAAIEATGRPFLLATQNVDGLHERAGSRAMVRLHGTLWRLRCTREGTEHDDVRATLAPLPPRCAACGALLRPAVVWFEEPLPMAEFRRAEQAARGALAPDAWDKGMPGDLALLASALLAAPI